MSIRRRCTSTNLADAVGAEVGEIMTKRLEFLRAENVGRFVAIAPPCHS
jgi:hypothetical protein